MISKWIRIFSAENNKEISPRTPLVDFSAVNFPVDIWSGILQYLFPNKQIIKTDVIVSLAQVLYYSSIYVNDAVIELL